VQRRLQLWHAAGRKPKGNDVVEEVDSFKIVTDKTNADILRGSKIDFIDTMQKQGFKIENPNVQGKDAAAEAAAATSKSFRR